MAFSFIHAADLHLDSPFRGLTLDLARHPDIAAQVRSATLDAFDALIDLARARKVDFILIAGDVYDSIDRSLRAQLHLRDGLARLAADGIGSFLVHGNHDPFHGRCAAIEWPAGIRIFSCEYGATEIITIDGVEAVDVTGISFGTRREERNLATELKVPDTPLYHIALLHCNVGANTGHDPYAQCELADLTEAGFDYWALGHVHERTILSRDPPVVYPGNSQGRTSREQGERGCYVVTVDDQHVSELAFVPLDTIRWTHATVDIAGLQTLDKLDEAVLAAVDQAVNEADGRSLVIRVLMSGNGPLFGELEQRHTVRELLERTRERFTSLQMPFHWVQDIRVDCRPEIDFEARRQGSDLVAQIVHGTDLIRESEHALTTALTPILAGLYGDVRASKALDTLEAGELAEILAAAERLCINLLESDSMG